MFVRTILVIIFSFSSLPCFGQALWKDSMYGMSEAQVLKVNPAAVKPIKSSRLGDGAQQLLEVSGIEVVKTKFTAKFYFKEDTLRQVMLGMDDGPSAGQAELIWDELFTILSSKYGKELNRKNQAGVLRIKNSTWVFGKTNISLLLMTVADGQPILNVVYQQRIAIDAGEL